MVRTSGEIPGAGIAGLPLCVLQDLILGAGTARHAKYQLMLL